MGLDGWLGLAHVGAIALWSSALMASALRDGASSAVSAAAAVAAFAAVVTGVWLLHREPRLLTMTHMHIKLAGLIALGAIDHLLLGPRRPAVFAGRAARIGALTAAVALVCAAALAGPEAA